MKDIVVFIHGMTIGVNPTPLQDYANLWDRVKKYGRDLGLDQWTECPVIYGSPTSGGADASMNVAQANLAAALDYKTLEEDSAAGNQLLRGWDRDRAGGFVGQTIRGLMGDFRNLALLRGFGDAVYYIGDGGPVIRELVFPAILKALEPFREEPTRLHIIAHSLGATVGFDFISSLNNHHCDHLQYPSDHDECLCYWRDCYKDARLQLGSFVTMAPQLPATLLRFQSVLDNWAKKAPISLADYGFDISRGTIWKNFFDVDDPLGYPIRPMFDVRETDPPVIMDIQVDTGKLADAHTEYWRDKSVHSEIAALYRSLRKK